MYSIIHSQAANIAINAGIRRVASVLALAYAMTFASGCALLSDNLERAAKAAGKIVVSYCENVTVQEVREEIAAAVNAKAAPHKVEITCADEIAAPAAPVE